MCEVTVAKMYMFPMCLLIAQQGVTKFWLVCLLASVTFNLVASVLILGICSLSVYVNNLTLYV